MVFVEIEKKDADWGQGTARFTLVGLTPGSRYSCQASSRTSLGQGWVERFSFITSYPGNSLLIAFFNCILYMCYTLYTYSVQIRYSDILCAYIIHSALNTGRRCILHIFTLYISFLYSVYIYIYHAGHYDILCAYGLKSTFT